MNSSTVSIWVALHFCTTPQHKWNVCKIFLELETKRHLQQLSEIKKKIYELEAISTGNVKMTRDNTHLDSQMILPIIGQGFVELSILLLCNVIWVSGPDWFHFIQFFIFSVFFLDFLLFLLILVFVLIFIIFLKVFYFWFVILERGFI